MSFLYKCTLQVFTIDLLPLFWLISRFNSTPSTALSMHSVIPMLS